MTSTYLNYRVYGANLPRAQQRVASMPENTTLQKYFDANIGKVKTADQFLNNYRLLTYALQAFGMTDMTNSKAFMRKVITSNLSDPNSFVNKLNDGRYKQFARAFNFDSKGNLVTAGSLQTSSQQRDLNARAGYDLAAQLAGVKTVKDLEGNDSLYSAVLDAFGLQGKVTKADVQAALETDRSKANNYLDGLGREPLRDLAVDFNFKSDGTIGASSLLQSPQNIAAAQDAYMASVPDDTASQLAATDEAAYYKKTITSLKSVDQVVADPRLVSFIKRAYGLEPQMTTSQLKAILTSNLAFAKSAANQFTRDPGNPSKLLQDAAQAFNFAPSGAILDRAVPAQSQAGVSSVVGSYMATISSDPQAQTAAQAEAAYYQSTIAGVASADEVVGDSRLVNVLKAAFNLPNASASDIKAILTSNLNDSSSAANSSGSQARKLALAFNFRSDGSIGASKLLQSSTMVTQTQRLYMQNILQDPDSRAQGADESTYYARKLADATSVDSLLSDPRVVQYLQIAYHLNSNWTTTDLKNILTGNVFDPTSAVNTVGQFDPSSRPSLSIPQILRSAFQIGTDGAALDRSRAAQKPDALNATVAAYASAKATSAVVAQRGETETSYYEFKLPQVTSVDQVVNDPRLVDYIKAAFRLPDATAADLKAILTSAPDDAKSAAATAGPAGIALRDAFTFDTAGAAGRPPSALPYDQLAKLVDAYNQAPLDPGAAATRAADSAYFLTNVLRAKSVDDIIADPRLVQYATTALGLTLDAPNAATLKKILTSNLADATSYANATAAKSTATHYLTASQKAAAAFNIGTDGTALDHSTQAQTTAAMSATASAYNKAQGIVAWSATRSLTDAEQAASDQAKAETDYYKYVVGRAGTVDDIVGDPRVAAYLKIAYNLPNATTSDLRAYLTSDLSTGASAADKAGGGARLLAAAFAFTSNGQIYTQQAIESQTNISATVKAYQAQAGSTAAAKTRAQTESDYFTSTMPRIQTVDQLLGNRRLVAYLRAAYSIPTTTTNATLRQVLTSNLKDPKSVANKLGSVFQTFAAAFNVAADGSISLAADSPVQSKTQSTLTRTNFLEQSVEQDAGSNYGDGVRLALYFRQKAPTLTNGYQILADKALTKVVQTALSLSSRASSADIDAQAKFIDRKIKYSDFKDPAKLDRFIAQFASLYDMQNSATSPTAAFG